MELPYLEIEPLNAALESIKTALDRGCKGGVLSLDEAWAIKIAHDRLVKAVEVLDVYEKTVMEANERAKQRQEQLNADQSSNKLVAKVNGSTSKIATKTLEPFEDDEAV